MVIRYFRQHPWQRRMVTATLALVVGGGAGVLGYPHVRDWLLIRDLADENGEVRMQAIARAAALAERSPRFYRRLESKLTTENDTQFAAIVTVLRDLEKFDIPARDPLLIDRMRAVEIAQTRSATDPRGASATRGMILTRVLLSERDNRYVRKALAESAVDEAGGVRRTAGVLAGRVGDDRTLRALLGDADPSVAAGAVLCAGLAGRGELLSDISALLDTSPDVGVVSSAAYALALLDGKNHSRRICDRLRTTRDLELRDRLLHVMTVLADDNAAATVAEILTETAKDGGFAPAAAIGAGDKLNLNATRRHAQSIAADASRRGTELRSSQVLAAFGVKNWSFNAEALAFCRTRWNPRFSLAMIAAVNMLGRSTGDEPGIALTEKVHTLRRAVRWEWVPATRPAEGGSGRVVTPVPSAAAAVALWKLGDESAGEHVRNVAAYDQTLGGDYAAWALGQLGEDRAFELGLAMLPPPLEPDLPPESQPPRVHNQNERSAGAMLLALSARTSEQIARAKRRIRSRLDGGPLGGERNFYVRGAYTCALLILGESARRPVVRELLATADFPQRRAMTALLVAGDRHGLDWMLWGPGRSDDYVAFLLIDKGLAEVLAACAPELPTVDPSASEGVMRWEVRILRDTYAIRRKTIQLGLERRPGAVP